MNEIKLSIIIPVYNAELYLEACIESCYRQGIAEGMFEVITINDGSTDKSFEILKRFTTKHTNIITIIQKNAGVSVARNKGIEIAQGKYLLFLDADDILVSESIAPMIAIADKYNTDILRADLIKLDNKEIESYNDTPLFVMPESIQPIDGEAAFIDYFNPMEGYVWRNLYKTNFLKENNILFLRGVNFIEDTAFNIHSYLSAKRFVSIPFVFYLYRQHAASAMATMNVAKLISANQVIEYIYKLTKKSNLSLPHKKKLLNSIKALLSVSLWYLSHYRSLYPHRKEIIDDLKSRVPKLVLSKEFNQCIISLCYHHCLSLYISFRYFWAKKKY